MTEFRNTMRLRTLAALAASWLCITTSPLATATEHAGTPLVQSEAVATVWAGHPVGFALLTEGDHQYIAYYDADRNMVVASRTLGSNEWTRKVLPTKIKWDSHNYVTLALDADGQLHVAGNMHVEPLIYFRTTKPGDVTTLTRIPRMVGKQEDRMTYSAFLKSGDGTLLFSYRDGQSGDGSTIYNRYDLKGQSWNRLLDKPLFDGRGKMNAYPSSPVLGPDGLWHMTWLWRDSWLAETTHDLCYAKSRDLINWETAAGKSVTLPFTIDTAGVIVDPIPVNGGTINGTGKLGFDDQDRAVITYHKFDDKGATQLYMARFENDGWKITPISNWSYRWEIKGGGTLVGEMSHSGLKRSDSGEFFIYVNHHHERDSGMWQIDPQTFRHIGMLRGFKDPDFLPQQARKAEHAAAGMGIHVARDLGTPPEGKRYVLVWETMPANRDYPREGDFPRTSTLKLVTLTPSPAP